MRPNIEISATPRNRDSRLASRPAMRKDCRSVVMHRNPTHACQITDPRRERMAGQVDRKLADLGIALPAPASPVANYVPFVRTGSLLFVSGQVCFDGQGKLVARGKLGRNVTIEDGQKAARACAINILAQVKAALGDLDRVARVVRLGGFIN